MAFDPTTASEGSFDPGSAVEEVKKPKRPMWGDAGSSLSAGEAYGALNDALEKMAYDTGGKVSDLAAKYLPPKVAAALGYGTNVGMQVVPTLMGGEAAKAIASPVVQSAAKSLMYSALKPSATSPAKGERAVETMLNEGYNVSQGGLDAMKRKIGDLNQEVSGAIARSPAQINRNDVANYTQDVVRKFENRPEALQAIKAAQDAEQAFVNHPMLSPGTMMGVQDAQRLKQGYQASIGEKGYGELKTPATEMEKAIARGLREKISAVVPEVAAPNVLESELINAAKRVQQRVAVEANKNPIGLGALISQPWMLPVWMWDRSALAKSMAARGLYSGSEAIPGAFGQMGAGSLMMQNGQAPQGRGLLYTE